MTTSNLIIESLYKKYGTTPDNVLQDFLCRVMIVDLKHNGIGTTYGYYPLTDEAQTKIIMKPRELSINFATHETRENPLTDLKEYRSITFLVKSSSRFFLKADMGEVVDAMDPEDLNNLDIVAICIYDEHEPVGDPEGEHFLMKATLFK